MTSPQHPQLKKTLKPLALLLAAAGLISTPAHAQNAPNALPQGGVVAAGSATISTAGNALTVQQNTNKAIIDWQSFNIGRDASVRFNQPSASATVLNRVGADGGKSLIDGAMSANGQVWLLNPGGMLFGAGANINVGGLLASTLNMGNQNFLDGNLLLSKNGSGNIVNQGTLTAAEGGYIALLAPEVRNEGVITARLGTVALASGDELRLDLSGGTRLIEVKVEQATVNSLIDNKNLIEAEGGWVLMSTDAASRLSQGAINNTGIVRATTLSTHEGVIKLLGGTTTVAGTLDASAPHGGNGGFIETSGHTVNIDPAVKISTLAAQGTSGNWLIDPNDFTVAATGGNISGATLATQLASGNVEIRTAVMGTAGGNGDIFINDAITWTAPSTLRLLAERNITINSNISGVNGIAWFSSGNLTGSPTSQISINSALSAATVSIGVASTAGTVSQTTAGVITTDALQIRGDANVALDTAANNVKTLAGAVNGTFSLNNGATSLVVNAQTFLQNSSTLTGLTATGNITLKTGADLTINAASGTQGAVISLEAAGKMTFGAEIGSTNANGIIRLTSGGDMTGPTSVSGGTGTGNDVIIRSGGNVDFSGTALPIRTIAAQLTGAGKSGAFKTSTATTIGALAFPSTGTGTGPVDGLIGITTNNGNLTISTTASTLTVANSINVGSGMLYLNTNTDNALFTLNSGASLTSTYAGVFSGSNVCGTSAAICIDANRMTIDGNISAASQYVLLKTGNGFARPVVLGADDTNAASASGGTLGLTNAELNRIKASTLAIANDPASVANLTVDGAVNLTGAQNLLLSVGGNVALNAPLTVSNQLSIQMGTTGSVTQTATAPLTVGALVAVGGQVVLNGPTTNDNAIGAVAANVTGTFWISNGIAASMKVQSINTVTGVVNGVTAGNIGLNTGGSLTLNAPLVATGTGSITAINPFTDPLCSAPCVRPHIELRGNDSFTNNVGAGAIAWAGSPATGAVPVRFWGLGANTPSTTKLNGLVPDAVTYDGASFDGDYLVSANRVFYYQTDVVASSPAASTASTAAATAVSQEAAPTPAASTETKVTALAPTGGTGSGGATMSNFATQSTATVSTTTSTATPSTEVVVAVAESAPPPPPPKLIVQASKTMPRLAGVLNRTDLQALTEQVHTARTALFEGALAQLEKDPKSADIADCGTGAGDLCLAKPLVAAGQDGYLPIVKRKVALMIGNNTYQSPIPSLETAVNDVGAIGQQLRDTLGYEVKVVENAGRKEIIDALNDLILTTGADDSVIVMYAGHGYLQEKTNTGYWIPSDASTSSPDKWISNDTITRALSLIPAKQVMLVSDSCYSGSLAKEGKVTETVGIQREQTLTRRSVMAFSSGGEEPVSDEGHDNHSIFAWSMIQSLKKMTTETQGAQLHTLIKDAVAKEFPQVPQYGTLLSAGHTEGGEYLLTPKTNGAQ